ncbi:ImmA/IrrE family metallo-endopeptidase [soil metagenome]
MSTVAVGDSLELAIQSLFQEQIDAGLFFSKDCCKVFRKKGYYSKDREAKIFFDVSIEMYMPGATEYSMLWLIECKNLSRSVSVDDAEEFFAKVDQVAGANGKAVLASNRSFQSGAKTFAKSKGMGLLRYFDPSNFKWELRRSSSGGARSTDADFADAGLSREDYVSTAFDLYMQSPTRATNSLWDFAEDLMLDSGLPPTTIAALCNRRNKPFAHVPFREAEDLETEATEVLADVGYLAGQVSLEHICAKEAARCGLSVVTGLALDETDDPNPVLGRIRFEPLEIQVYAQAHVGRERFSLAHELAHHLLGHGSYMVRESSDEEDFVLKRKGLARGTDIARMEFQANYFAASLLMPRLSFVNDFRLLMRLLDVSDRGFGSLYVDNQACNLQTFMHVTGQLMQRYGVSRAATTIRLESLGLLKDARNSQGPRSVQSVF